MLIVTARPRSAISVLCGFRESTPLHVSTASHIHSSWVSKQNIGLNRKVLADLAMNNPQAFEAIVNSVK